MRTGLRGLVLALTAALALSAMPFATALAVDVATTTTLGPVAATVYRGDTIHIAAFVSPIPPSGTVTWEWSLDDTTWTVMKTDSVFPGDGSSGGFLQLDASIPIGDLDVRARFHGAPGFLGSTSSTKPMTMERAPSGVETFTLTSAYETILPGYAPLTLTAVVNTIGNVTFEQAATGGWTELGTVALDDQHKATLQIGPLDVGPATFRARFLGNDDVAPSEKELSIDLAKATLDLTVHSPGDVQANHPFEITVTGSTPFHPPTGKVTLKEKVSGTTLGSGPLGTPIAMAPRPAGSFTIVASYPGDASYLAGSAELPVTIVADVVDASGVGVSATSIYPFVDGYRDTVAIRGTRDETASVSIRIYSPSNSLVRGATIASGNGNWSFTWNGKAASGASLAAGKYRITQTVKDSANTTAVFTHYVTLSTKRLSYKTVYITKNGSAVTAKGDPGNGSITLSSSGLATLKSGGYPNGWVGVGYQFTLPSATVYKSIAFQAYVKGPRTVPPNGMGMQNFQTCPYSSSAAWDEGCFSLNANPAATSYTWITSAGSATRSRYGRTARGMISVNVGTVYVSKVRIKLVYGVLV